MPVVLKVKDKDGNEKVLAREMVRVDPTGKSKKVQLRDQPREAGRKLYIVEVELPKPDRPDKVINPGQTRLERTIDGARIRLGNRASRIFAPHRRRIRLEWRASTSGTAETLAFEPDPSGGPP